MIKINPYTPGAGVKPGFLAGRDDMIKSAEETIAYYSAGQTHQSYIFYGLRGVGKTVLLNVIEDIAEKYEYIYEHLEVSENDNFKIVIAKYIQKIVQRLSNFEKAKDKVKTVLGLLKAFTFTIPDYGEFTFDVDAISGKSDTGNFQNDLTELFLAVGKLASNVDKKIAFFIDEIQYMKKDDLEALIAATHRIHQKNYPLVIFGAGLPKIAKMSGDAKSYSERLYNFVKIDSLSEPNAKLALINPIKVQDVSYSDEAIKKIIEITDGYPYFLQEFGRQVWEVQTGNTITEESVYEAYEKFIKKLDNSFFKVRFDRATGNEKIFMFAMADLGKGPYETKAIANKLQKEQNQISLDRANLINKGFVYTTSHGFLDFTVPQFDKFLNRIKNH